MRNDRISQQREVQARGAATNADHLHIVGLVCARGQEKLDADIALPELRIGCELVGVTLPDNATTFQDRVAICKGYEALDVLVNHENRLALLTQ